MYFVFLLHRHYNHKQQRDKHERCTRLNASQHYFKFQFYFSNQFIKHFLRILHNLAMKFIGRPILDLPSLCSVCVSVSIYYQCHTASVSLFAQPVLTTPFRHFIYQTRSSLLRINEMVILHWLWAQCIWLLKQDHNMQIL